MGWMLATSKNRIPPRVRNARCAREWNECLHGVGAAAPPPPFRSHRPGRNVGRAAHARGGNGDLRRGPGQASRAPSPGRPGHRGRPARCAVESPEFRQLVCLFGDYNPAGRLRVTFYKSAADLPPFEDYAMAGRTYRYFAKEVLYLPAFADRRPGQAGGRAGRVPNRPRWRANERRQPCRAAHARCGRGKAAHRGPRSRPTEPAP